MDIDADFRQASVVDGIGRYSFGRVLGIGSSSLVRLARDSANDIDCACKIVPRRRINLPSLRTRFEEEVMIFRRLSHPGIVHLYDVMQDSENYYLFMEYCAHGELFNLVRQHGHLSEVQSRFVIREVFEAVNYVHSQGIAHRDIKLENIFLSRKCHVKLGDFGLGKYVGADGLCGTSCGSPYYASPECLSGNSYNAKKSDVWSCGVALYWMLVGHPPWTERNHFQLFEQIRKGELKIPESLPEDCQDLLSRLLTVDPNKRIGIPEVFEHPWIKAGPNPKFPEEGPIPYIGLRRIESLFEDALPTLDSFRGGIMEAPSVRASSISHMERLLIPEALKARAGSANGLKSEGERVTRRVRPTGLPPVLKGAVIRPVVSRKGARVLH
jgi:serine/threonine protein kinase